MRLLPGGALATPRATNPGVGAEERPDVSDHAFVMRSKARGNARIRFETRTIL